MTDARRQSTSARRASKAGASLPPAFDESVATLDNRRKSVVGSSADPSKKRNSATVAVADANSLDASKGRRSSTAAGKAAPTAAAADANNLDTSKGRRSSTAAGKAGPTAVAVDANSLDTSKGRRTSGGKATPTGAGEAVAASKGDNLLTVPKGDPIKKKVKPKEKKKPKGPVPGSCRWRFVRFIRQLYMSYVNCCITMPCYSFDVYRWAPEMASYRALFTRLGLAEREVGVFYVFYSRVDQDHSGAISIYELLEFLNVERTDFSKRVFAIFDEDGNGTIDFREFVIALWNYATLTPSSLVLFAFDMYDKDGSGVLELAEIKKMLVEVYGPQYASNPHARQMVLDLHDKMGVALGMPVYMKVTEFESLCKNRPAMLMPAFIFQDALRSRICGTSFWQACMSKRLQLSNGEYVSIATLMQAAVNDEVAQGVIAADRVGKDHEVATKNSSAMNFMKSIGGNLARRRGDNDLGRDKIREALERAKQVREAAKANKKMAVAIPASEQGSVDASASAAGGGAAAPVTNTTEKRASLVKESSLEQLLANKPEKKVKNKPK